MSTHWTNIDFTGRSRHQRTSFQFQWRLLDFSVTSLLCRFTRGLNLHKQDETEPSNGERQTHIYQRRRSTLLMNLSDCGGIIIEYGHVVAFTTGGAPHPIPAKHLSGRPVARQQLPSLLSSPSLHSDGPPPPQHANLVFCLAERFYDLRDGDRFTSMGGGGMLRWLLGCGQF